MDLSAVLRTVSETQMHLIKTTDGQCRPFFYPSTSFPSLAYTHTSFALVAAGAILLGYVAITGRVRCCTETTYCGTDSREIWFKSVSSL